MRFALSNRQHKEATESRCAVRLAIPIPDIVPADTMDFVRQSLDVPPEWVLSVSEAVLYVDEPQPNAAGTVGVLGAIVGEGGEIDGARRVRVYLATVHSRGLRGTRSGPAWPGRIVEG